MPTLEYVTVANHAESINGLLYLQGAGWSEMRPPLNAAGQTGNAHFGIAISVLIGWNETNRPYPLTIRMSHEDGAVIMEARAQIEQGRPPGMVHGADLRSMIAINMDHVFVASGTYEIRAELGAEVKTASFRVTLPTPAAPPQQIGPSGFFPT